MAIGRIPSYMLGSRPRGGQLRNLVQQPAEVILAELLGLARGRRGVEIATVPKRSLTYFGSLRPARAPRILPLGRENEPTEQLRRTLVGRTRWLQDQAQTGGSNQQ